ncbi:MAG: DUF4468 domain-containing protein [Bacteroidota bacterium]|nr:DUF4468 domain-containing protein [Bacteroidota bacterium]
MSQNLPVNADTKLITYSEVVQTKGTKNELYDRAVDWIGSFYKKSPIDICQTLNKNDGVIEGGWKIKLYETDNAGSKKEISTVTYILNISVKDGRYKYTFTKFIWKKPPPVPAEKWLDKKAANYDPVFDDYAKQVTDYMKDMIASLKKGMAPKDKNSTDW